MSTATDLKAFTPQDYKADIHNDWCPGCGDFGILSAIQMSLAKLQIPPYRTAVVSGIGCSGKTPHYMNTYAFHTLHGRVMPSVTGLKLANHELTVIGVGGDGDGYGIGAGHFVSGGRRNLDITYIVFNNDVYALTKGQASPTIGKGQKTKSMSDESIMEPINPVLLGLACGYTFVARGYALDTKYLVELITQGIRHRGTALIDVLQTCPTYNDLHSKSWYAEQVEGQPRLYKLEDTGYDPLVHDPADPAEVTQKKAQALLRSQDPSGRIALGVYYKLEVPTYEDFLKEKIPALESKPLVDLDIYHRDITPNLQKLM
ncbi:MAG: 2-oxoacid:ferredoxin oxidoreductase subunit beta [Acidobacteriota bacterium]|nr:2-oxoacid:ferredoxin oxidoreductase subunit beta [Acidobacteriota bacterium]